MASPITCHVLNTLDGTPAFGLNATLELLHNPPNSSTDHVSWGWGKFTAKTDHDGRVKQWESESADGSVADDLAQFPDGERLAWSIKLAIGPWYEAQGIECFWPEIEVKFYVRKGERHYHVPVLVGPWTYTTYRGS
jgi:5-hydroxyisourate hydrolase